MGCYGGVSDNVKAMSSIYIGVNNSVKKVTEVYTNINGSVVKVWPNGFTYYLSDTYSEDDGCTSNSSYTKIEDGVYIMHLYFVCNRSQVYGTYRQYVYGDLAGKTLTYQYKNTKYSVTDWTCEYIEYDSDGNKLYTKALNTASSWVSVTRTIDSSCSKICFGYWVNKSSSGTYYGTLQLQNVYVGDDQILC